MFLNIIKLVKRAFLWHQGNYVIRFTVTSAHTKLTDIQRDWEVIKSIAAIVIDSCAAQLNTMAGDDQLEEEENGPLLGDNPNDEEGVPRRTTRMPLAGKKTILDLKKNLPIQI